MFGELACVISNHDQLKAASEGYGIPFYQVPVSADSKADAEARQMDIIRQHDIRLVVLLATCRFFQTTFFSSLICQ